MARTGNKFSLSSRISLSDGFSKPLRVAGRAFDSFTRNVRDKNHILGRSMIGLNKSINYGLLAGTGALAIGLGLAGREFVKFDQAIIGARARFADLKIGTKEYDSALIDLKKSARDVGATTQFTAAQAAEGLNFYAKAGFSSKEAMAALKDQIDMATVAEMDFSRAADISSDLLSSFGLNANDSATKIQNLAMMNRALGLTANLANVDLEDLFETLKGAAPIAKQLGATTNELIAMTGALGGAGIKGTLAETALKNMYANMVDPTAQMSNALKSIGLTTKDFLDSDGSLKMIKALSMIGSATKNLSKMQRSKVFFDIFGMRAVAGAANLANSLYIVDDIMKGLESDSKLSTIADEIRKGLGMQLEILKSTALEKAFQYFEGFGDSGGKGINALVEIIKNIDVKPFVEMTKVLLKFISFAGDNWKVLLSLAIGIKAVSLAVGILGVALSANPLGAAVLAVGALAAGLTLLITNYGKLEEISDRMEKARKSNGVGGKKIVTVTDHLKNIWGKIEEASNRIEANRNGVPYGSPQIYNSAYSDSITPKSTRYSNFDLGKGTIDINFGNMPSGASVQSSGSSRFNLNPVLQP